ncbi:MAG: hypothetical protein LBN09_04240 [Clostridioides sp.]|jgi:predicted transcriptional regulator|nr:hypothetical protein [Clostridioides sp.]
MKYKIGFVTANGSNNYKISEILKDLSDRCDVETIEFNNFRAYSELLDVYHMCEKKYDGLVFSNAVAYSMIRFNVDDIKIPIGYIRINEKDFHSETVLKMIDDGGHDPSRIFVDFLIFDDDYYDIIKYNAKNDYNAFAIFDMFKCPYIIMYPTLESQHSPFSTKPLGYKHLIIDTDLYSDKLITIHQYIWENNLADLLVTSSSVVAEQLKELGYNYLYMTPSDSSVFNTFRHMISLLDIKKLDDNKSATGIITMDSHKLTDERFLFESEIILDDLYHSIKNFLSKKGFFGIEVEKKSLRIELNTTKSVLLDLTAGYKRFFFNDLLEKMYYILNIGWGVGNTKSHSESNARAANIKSSEHKGNCSFVIDENDKVYGPLRTNSKYSSSANHQAVEMLSKNIPLSSSSIHKIIAVIEQRGNNDITSRILADHLNVTVRTANRILKVLHEANIASLIYDTGISRDRGRPEKIYRIDFTPALSKFM